MRSDQWPTIAGHRERLLRIARRRCPTREDAEDIVSEAMLRCATFENLDEHRLEQFLTAVTVRLCADHYRKAERRGRALVKLASDPDVIPGPEEELLGGVDALVLEALMASLPERQRAVLFDRADGLSVTQIASRHELTYKATESALARARGTMRAALATALAGVAAFVRWVRPKHAAVVALPAVTLVLAGTVVRVPLDDDRTDALPREVPIVTDADTVPGRPRSLPVAKPAARQSRPVVAAAPITDAQPVFVKKDNDVEVVKVGDDKKVIKTTVTSDPDWTPQWFVEQCVEHGPYVEVNVKPGGPYDVKNGCGESAAG